MPIYRIFRMKDHERQRFRWAPHTSGTTLVKPRDFEENGTFEAPSVYAAWNEMKATETPIDIGDMLAGPGEEMRILKYIGFEEARWLVPEVKPTAESPAPVPAGGPAVEAEPRA